LHLAGDCGEVSEAPRCPSSMETPFQRGLELDGTKQQRPAYDVGLAAKRAPACRLERRSGLAREIGWHHAVELREQGRGVVAVVGADLDELIGTLVPEPVGEAPVQRCPRVLGQAGEGDGA